MVLLLILVSPADERRTPRSASLLEGAFGNAGLEDAIGLVARRSSCSSSSARSRAEDLRDPAHRPRRARSSRRSSERPRQLPAAACCAAPQGLIGLANVILPGKGLKHGTRSSTEEDLRTMADIVRGRRGGTIETARNVSSSTRSSSSATRWCAKPDAARAPTWWPSPPSSSIASGDRPRDRRWLFPHPRATTGRHTTTSSGSST